MNGNDFDYEWDIDGLDLEDWLNNDAAERQTAERTISNEDFLIHRLSEKEFRLYIIRELNKIKSSLSFN